MIIDVTEQLELSGEELAELILTRLNQIILEKMHYKLVLTPGYFTLRGVIEPHYKLSLDVPANDGLEDVVKLARRHVWLPFVREGSNNNMFFITFILINEDLDPSEFDSTGFSYCSVDHPGEWNTDDAAMHIYTYLSEQMLDGSKFE
jgi:hypothetical protein